MSTKIRLFDIITLHKIHENKIFDSFQNNQSIQINISKSNLYNSYFIKSRPAIVLNVFSDFNNNMFFVAPLTTQNINKETIAKFRSPLYLNNKKSYIMWDSLMRVNKNQITNFYVNNKKIVRLSNEQKNYIANEYLAKMNDIQNIPILKRIDRVLKQNYKENDEISKVIEKQLKQMEEMKDHLIEKDNNKNQKER